MIKIDLFIVISNTIIINKLDFMSKKDRVIEVIVSTQDHFDRLQKIFQNCEFNIELTLRQEDGDYSVIVRKGDKLKIDGSIIEI
jgi:hypothetical protein